MDRISLFIFLLEVALLLYLLARINVFELNYSQAVLMYGLNNLLPLEMVDPQIFLVGLHKDNVYCHNVVLKDGFAK